MKITLKNLLKRKRGGDTRGLKDYVKKSNSEEKMIKVLNKQGEAVFEKKSKVQLLEKERERESRDCQKKIKYLALLLID